MISSEMMKHILLYIKSAYDGALSPLFNGITNIEAEDFIDFDMRDLMQGSEECQRAVLFNISTYLWNRILLKEGWTMLAIDELHMYLQHPYMRKTLQSMVLRARKYNAMIWCATQQITHCLNPQYAYEVSSLLNSSPIKFLFNLGDVELGEVKKALSQLRTKYDEQRAITIESNCMIFMFSALAPSASQTAKRISEMLGNETIMTGSKSISKGVTTTNTSLAGRPLLTPSQLVRLPWGQFIVQKTGYAPYIAHMRPYKDYLKLEAEQQVPPPSLRYSSVLSASAAMIEAVAKGHLYHLRKGMFDSEDSDW